MNILVACFSCWDRLMKIGSYAQAVPNLRRAVIALELVRT